jgi:hypothetical protein
MTDQALTAAYAAESELESKIGRREMRQAGLTLLNVRRRTKEMARHGELTADMTPEQIRDTVLDDLYAANPHELQAINWDALLAFIEKLLPLILQLIALFG